MKVWNFIGRADHIPNPGDYFALEMVGIPVIVVRDDAGRLRAFVNSCRHRGTVLVEGEGNCRAFKCPYHSWVYALDGELLGAPEMQKTSNFDCAQYPLVPVRLESWAGFLFINFDPKAEPLASYLGDLPANLAGHTGSDLVCTRRKVYELNCNWKLFAENAKESYHIATVHRKTINQYASAEIARYEYVAGAWPVRDELRRAFRQHGPLEGRRGLPRHEDARGSGSAGHALAVHLSQHLRRGHDRRALVPGAASARSGPDDARPRRLLPAGGGRAIRTSAELAQNYYRRWDITIDEDNAICEMQQRGPQLAHQRARALLLPGARRPSDRQLGARSRARALVVTRRGRRVRLHIENVSTMAPVFQISPEQYEAAAARHRGLAARVDATIAWDLASFDEAMRTADVLIGWRFPREDLARRAPRLEWIHMTGAGIEHIMPLDWLPPGAVVTTNSGVHALKAGEFAAMAMLMISNRIPSMFTAQREGRWHRMFTTPVRGKTLADHRRRRDGRRCGRAGPPARACACSASAGAVDAIGTSTRCGSPPIWTACCRAPTSCS